MDNSKATFVYQKVVTSGITQGLGTSVAVSVVISLFFGLSLQYLWGLLNCSQILGFFTMMDLTYPANVKMLLQAILNVVTFNIMDVVGDLKKSIGIDIGSSSGQTNETFEASGFASTSIFENLGSMLPFLVLIPIAGIAIAVTLVCARHSLCCKIML